ncbi:HAD family hydrolase [Angustibacter aerolatus]
MTSTTPTTDPAPVRADDLDARLADVEVVLCDADGNLFPSEEPAFVASADVTNRLLATLGVDRRYDAEELRLATTGMNFRSTARALADEHGADLSDDELQRWVAEEQAAVTAHLHEVLRRDPAVEQPLRVVAGCYGVAAVSSSADARIAACFDATGLADLFPPDRRFSAEDSMPRPVSKPDPAIYRFALDALGLARHQAVAVEDSVAGATSAVGAGIATIGNLQFVQAPERVQRRDELEAAGVLAVVGSWQEAADLLPRCRELGGAGVSTG